MRFPNTEHFVRSWQASACVTEVSLRLVRAGYACMHPRRCLRWAQVLREAGLKLKHIERGSLPASSAGEIVALHVSFRGEPGVIAEVIRKLRECGAG